MTPQFGLDGENVELARNVGDDVMDELLVSLLDTEGAKVTFNGKNEGDAVMDELLSPGTVGELDGALDGELDGDEVKLVNSDGDKVLFSTDGETVRRFDVVVGDVDGTPEAVCKLRLSVAAKA